ncbi:membrane protein [Streptococcus equi subsp. zooepidemicus Sz35]|nr:membrane protein [Streptococcus equi subsp. zooepidemicus Sz35]
MVMLMRTLLFPIDNGMDNNLIGDGLSVEYDLWTGKVTWRQPSDNKIRTQQKVAFVLNLIAGSLSPLAIFLFVVIVRRLGVFSGDTNSMIFKWAPLIVGVILFISFELLMLALRSRYTILEKEPDLDRQLYYYRTMYDNTIHDNSGVFNNLSVPYVGLYITFFLIF